MLLTAYHRHSIANVGHTHKIHVSSRLALVQLLQHELRGNLILEQHGGREGGRERGAQVRKASRVIGRMASVSPVSTGLVMNMKMRPKVATTMERRATLMLCVPALFISRVSCAPPALVSQTSKTTHEDQVRGHRTP